jgi:iron complex outermembrane receptor protein
MKSLFLHCCLFCIFFKTLGQTIRRPDTATLKAAVIRAEKPLFRHQLNGTVVNAGNSILTKGSNTLEVLERSPGIVIDRRSNSISLNGKSGVVILLNGKRLRMSQDQLVDLLNSMPADNVEKIELMTSPPAGYDADGAAGIVNIVLKKNREKGTNGSLTASTGYGYREKASASLNLSHNSQKADVYGSYSFSHDRNEASWHALSTQDLPLLGGPTSADFISLIRPRSNSHTVTGGLDIRLNPGTTIGSSISYSNSRTNTTTQNTGTYIVLPDSPLLLNATIRETNRWNNLLLTFYGEKNIGGDNRFSFDLDLLDYKNNHPTDAQSSFVNEKGEPAGNNDTLSSPRQKGFSATGIRVAVGKLDFKGQLNRNIRLETGIKGTYTKTSGISGIESLVEDQWVHREGTSSNMEMKEAIGAGYISLTAAPGPSTSLVAGLRYEYSDTRMDNPDGQQPVIQRRMGQLFPSLFFSQKTGAASELQLAYTIRISRPAYNDLASYVIYTGPTSVETGNPTLKPTITNSLKLGYSYHGYSFSVTLSRDDNPIVRYQIASSTDGVLMALTPENLTYQNSLLLQASLPVRVSNWWTMNYSITSGWRKYREDFTPAPAEMIWFGYSGNFSQSFRLPRSFSLEVAGWYNSRSYDGTRMTDPFGALNAGIKKELNNNGGTLQLYMTDILRTTVYINHYGTMTTEAFALKSRVPFQPESYRYQSIRFSYSRSFGSGARSRPGVGSSDERNRIRE